MKYETVPVAIILADDSVAIMRFVVLGRGITLPDGASWIANEGWWARPAKSEFIEHEVRRAFPDAKSWSHLLDESIPEDRTFRDALVVEGGRLVYSLPIAKEIVLRNVRHERARKLEDLDRQYMRHVGINQTEAAKIEAERQRLRDLPASLERRMAGVNELEALRHLMVL